MNFKPAISPALWKRVLVFLGCLAVIAVVAFAFFYPDAAQGNVLKQHDMTQGFANGHEAQLFEQQTGETTRWTNSLFSGMPTFQISPSYPSNSLFSWLDSVMGLGLPSPANLIAMMMVGFFILLLALGLRWWVALIGAVAYGFSSYFVIIIGAGHIWKFLTLAYVPPTIGGIVLAYRGKWLAGSALAALFAMLQIAANHIQMTYYFLFVVVGFVIVYLIEALKQKQFKQWAGATGCLAVAGILAVVANSPSLYNTYEYSKETMRGAHSELTRPQSQAQTSGLDLDYITQYSYQPSETFSFLIPNVKGGASAKPEQGSVKILSLSSLPDAQAKVAAGEIDQMEAQYLEYMSQYFGDPEGTNGPVYVGALIFALFLVGLAVCKGPMKWMLLILTLLSIGLAWGRHAMWLTESAVSWLPMYSKFRTVESILVIAEFTMPLLAALALQKILSGGPEVAWTQYRKPIFWGFGISLAICALGIIWPGFFGDVISENDRNIDAMIQQQLQAGGYDPQSTAMFSLNSPRIYGAVTELRNSLIEADALRSLIILGIGLPCLALWMKRKLNLAATAIVLGVLVLGDLFLVNKRYLDHDSFVPKRLSTGEPVAMTPADRQILADTVSNYRVMDLQRFFSAEPSYFHKSIGGYHAAKLTRYQDLIDIHLQPIVEGNPSEADIQVLNMLNAKYIVDHNGSPFVNEEAFGNAWLVDSLVYVANADNEMAALDQLNLRTTAVADQKFANTLGSASRRLPGDTIIATSYAPNRLTYSVNSAKGGVAVFSEVYFPWGWNATIDGKPAEIGRANYLLRAMRVPAGKHTIVMTFDPQSLHTTTTAAYIAIILIYAALLAAIGCALMPRRPKEHALNS